MRLFRFGEQGKERPAVELHDSVRKDCSSMFDDWNGAFFENDGIVVAGVRIGLPFLGLALLRCLRAGLVQSAERQRMGGGKPIDFVTGRSAINSSSSSRVSLLK